MKRDKYWESEKNFHKLERELSNNQDIQDNLGYMQLTEPIPNGYTVKLVLRNDIANRDDAWIFQAILDNYSKPKWWRKNYSAIKNLKNLDVYYYTYPSISKIDEEEYNSLKSVIKKCFSISSVYNRFNKKEYFCNIP